MSSSAGGVVTVSEVEFAEAMTDAAIGFCVACGCSSYGVEPDAERYRCDYCSELKVYGAEQLLIMGRLRVVPERREGVGDGR
jgi:hypothetical protein